MFAHPTTFCLFYFVQSCGAAKTANDTSKKFIELILEKETLDIKQQQCF